MKKLFISCPMKDRTEAQIRGTMMQMHNIAEAVFGEELDVIQTIFLILRVARTRHFGVSPNASRCCRRPITSSAYMMKRKRTVVAQSRTRPQRLTAFPVTPST